jgi:hypothetical protein
MRVALLFFIFSFFSELTMASYLYSGRVSSFAESDSILVTYSHKSEFNVEKSIAEQFSTLAIYKKSKKGGQIELDSKTELKELLVFVDLIKNSEFIIGISNLNIDSQPDIYIYDITGKRITTAKIDCNESVVNEYPVFCPRVYSPEQIWFNEQLNLFEAYQVGNTVNVCFSRKCIALEIEKT